MTTYEAIVLDYGTEEILPIQHSDKETDIGRIYKILCTSEIVLLSLSRLWNYIILH